MKPVFTTKRFEVFHLNCERRDEWDVKDVYVAFYHDEDVAAAVCTITINRDTMIGDYVEWVEVREQDRRNGIASELIEAIEIFYGTDLVMDGASDAGDAFVAKYNETHPA